MSFHLGVLGRCPVDHAVNRRVRCIELEIGQETVQGLSWPSDEVLIADQVRMILSLRPRAAEIANRAVAQEIGEVGVGFNVRGSKGTTSEFLVKGEHGAVDVAKIANQEDLFRLWVKLPHQPGEIVGAVLFRHVFDIGLTLAGRDAQVRLLGAALTESGQILHVVAAHPFTKTRRDRYWLGVERVVADPLLVGLEVIGLGRVIRVSRFSERLQHVPPIPSRAQLIWMPAMDDDFGMLGEEAHRPRRAGATHRREHERLQTRLESGLDRLVTERDTAQPRSGAIGQHGAQLKIGPRLEPDHTHPGAKAARSGTGRIGEVASDVGSLLIQRCLANDDSALMNFDFLDGLADSQDPSRELDVVDIATADAGSIDRKRLNLAGPRRSKFDIVDFDQRHEPGFPFWYLVSGFWFLLTRRQNLRVAKDSDRSTRREKLSV